MAVSIKQRPLGHILDLSTSFTVDITRFSPTDGSALFSSNALSGILDGDYIYVVSEVDDYNGFWYVEVITFNTTFQVKRNATDAFVNHVKDVFNARFYVVQNTHGWNCVHLPIVYKLSTDLWPVNSVDTVRTMTVTDSNGYCAIAASGDIKTTGSAAALEYVKVTNAGDYNGVYQIISYTNDTTFVIDLAYSSAADTALTAGNIQYYYNNYVVKIEIWGGLGVGHTYYSEKPYELLATLEVSPDEDNSTSVSISGFLKDHIEIKNNLLLGTLPNNLDAFTQFFIKYGEEYDDSDGTTLSRSTVSYTSDLVNFEGYAVNAMLPFKNIYSGAMSEYLIDTDSGIDGKFLTNFERPTIFSGKYFDLSFIFNLEVFPPDYENKGYLKRTSYLNESFVTSTAEAIAEQDQGVYRASLEADCDVEDQLDVSVCLTEVDSNSQSNPFVGGPQAVTIAGGAISPAYTGPVDLTVSITGLSIGGSSGGSCLATVRLRRGGASGTVISSAPSSSVSGNTSDSDSATVAVEDADYIDILLQGQNNSPGVGAYTVDAEVEYTLYREISEVKTIDINCECLPANAVGFNLSWLNNLGGFDHYHFMSYSDHIIDITESGEEEENIFQDWPNSYGEFADTVRKQTFRTSRKQALVRSQNLTLEQLQVIQFIKTSPLVQIVNSIYDRRTVILDTDSWTVYREGQIQQDKEQYTISFTITYTDDVPSQRV